VKTGPVIGAPRARPRSEAGKAARAFLALALLAPALGGAAFAQSGDVPHYIPRSLDDEGAPIPWGSGGGGAQPHVPSPGNRPDVAAGAPALLPEARPPLAVAPSGGPIFAPLQAAPGVAGMPGAPAAPAEPPQPAAKGWEFFKIETQTKTVGPKIGLSGRASDFEWKLDPDGDAKGGPSLSTGIVKREVSVGGSAVSYGFGDDTGKGTAGILNFEASAAGGVTGKRELSQEVGVKASAFRLEAGNERVKVDMELLSAEAEASATIDLRKGKAAAEVGATVYVVKTSAEATFPVGAFDVVIGGRVGYGAGAKAEGEIDLSKGKAKYGLDIGTGLLWGIDIGIAPRIPDRRPQPPPLPGPALPPRPRRRRAGIRLHRPGARGSSADDGIFRHHARPAPGGLRPGGLGGR
jgi:hypothetical protein